MCFADMNLRCNITDFHPLMVVIADIIQGPVNEIVHPCFLPDSSAGLVNKGNIFSGNLRKKCQHHPFRLLKIKHLPFPHSIQNSLQKIRKIRHFTFLCKNSLLVNRQQHLVYISR